MEQLSGFDATFLYAESPWAPMEIASCVITDPSRSPHEYSFDLVKRAVESRLHLAPRLRQRLVRVPFELDRPVWVDDSRFDIDHHVRRAALPTPGGRAELQDYVADALSHSLDRTRPLWELHVIEGLEDGKVGGFVKTHHAAVDGVAGFELLTTFLDEDPRADPTTEQREEWHPARTPSPLELVVRSVPSLASQPLRTARTFSDLVGATLGRRRSSSDGKEGRGDKRAQEQRPDRKGWRDAPPTRFNADVTSDRRVALVDLSFEDVAAVAERCGCTINDVLVATVGGAVRSYLVRHDDLPDEPLVAFVPVSTRGGDGGSSGNRTSLVYASMGTDVEGPEERLAAVAASTRRAKSDHQRSGAGMPTDFTAVAGPAGAAVTGRLLAESKAFRRLRLGGNVVISNIRGPEAALHLAGAPIDRLYPLGPIVDGNALNVTVLSYRRRDLAVGLVADPETVPDLDELAEDLRASAAELAGAAAEV